MFVKIYFMKVTVILNLIPLDDLDAFVKSDAVVTNVDATKIANAYKKESVTHTLDGKAPYVVVKAYLSGRIDATDRNFR